MVLAFQDATLGDVESPRPRAPTVLVISATDRVQILDNIEAFHLLSRLDKFESRLDQIELFGAIIARIERRLPRILFLWIKVHWPHSGAVENRDCGHGPDPLVLSGADLPRDRCPHSATYLSVRPQSNRRYLDQHHRQPNPSGVGG